MQIAKLQAKRASLQSSLEHLVGQVNRVSGAIAVVDELIAEAKSEIRSVKDVSFQMQQCVASDSDVPRRSYTYLFRLLLNAGCSVAEADRVARECAS